MPGPARATAFAGALAALLVAPPVRAEISIDWVSIGAPHNPDDDTGAGRVDSHFRIARYETTKAQYAAFLDAVAADDTFELWFPVPGASHVERSGSPGRSKLSFGAKNSSLA